jgi:hypothetical protein
MHRTSGFILPFSSALNKFQGKTSFVIEGTNEVRGLLFIQIECMHSITRAHMTSV